MDRIEKLKADPLYLECLSNNGLRERDREFCRHDDQHMLLVSQISCQIISETAGFAGFARREGLPGPEEAAEVVRAAGLLHDMGRWKQYDSGENHAPAGARLARGVLKRAGFSPAEIRIITRAILEHRRAGPGASCLGRVLCLADDLSRPCGSCGARSGCYKYEHLENLKEKNRAAFCLDAG